MSTGNSYGQILRSSSIIGGAQAINYVVAPLRVKGRDGFDMGTSRHKPVRPEPGKGQKRTLP